MSKITKEVWKEIDEILKKHELSYTAHYEYRNIKEKGVTVIDKYIEINLVIPDLFEEGK